MGSADAGRREYCAAGGTAVCEVYAEVWVECRAMGAGLYADQEAGGADAVVLTGHLPRCHPKLPLERPCKMLHGRITQLIRHFFDRHTRLQYFPCLIQPEITEISKHRSVEQFLEPLLQLELI